MHVGGYQELSTYDNGDLLLSGVIRGFAVPSLTTMGAFGEFVRGAADAILRSA